jgi:hypothetical protein
VTPEELEAAAALPAEEKHLPDRKLLPMRLSPFAPPDAEAEARTSARLQQMSFSMLRTRRARIDKKLYELGLSVGEPALAIPSVRGTGLVDIDRIIRKVDTLDRAREQAKLEREAEGKTGLFGAIDLSWLSDAFRFREIRARRNLLVSELGLALCASDLKQVEEYAPHVRRLLKLHVATAHRIDELFTEMRLVDDEFERRSRMGLIEETKEIDTLISKALDQVDDVGSKAVDTISELGISAAKTAVTGGGQAVWGIVRESAKGAFRVGSRKLLGNGGDDPPEGSIGAGDPLDAPVPEPGAASATASRAPAQAPPRGSGIPQLLRELARLRDEGIISSEEFVEKKDELLKRL